MSDDDMIFDTGGLEEFRFEDVGALLVTNGILTGIFYARMMCPPDRDPVMVPVKRFAIPVTTVAAVLTKLSGAINEPQADARAAADAIRRDATSH